MIVEAWDLNELFKIIRAYFCTRERIAVEPVAVLFNNVILDTTPARCVYYAFYPYCTISNFRHVLMQHTGLHGFSLGKTCEQQRSL